jgi:hypothetical protein
VQNAHATQLERQLSVTDQRNRFVASTVYEPKSFHDERPILNALFNNWKVSTVFAASSGRPISATIAGDANRDDNSHSDRLPGPGGTPTLVLVISPPMCASARALS